MCITGLKNKLLLLGFLLCTGNIMLCAQNFDYVSTSYNEGLAYFRQGGKYGFLDKNKKVVIKNEYDEVKWFREGMAGVKKGGKWGFIDKQGNVILPFAYEDVESFGEGLVSVKKNGKWGFIDKEGNTVIEFKYGGYGGRFENGYAAVTTYGRDWGMIDKSGREVVPLKYDDLGSYTDGLMPASLNNKWGFIDINNNVIIKFKYENATSFVNGLSCVQLDYKCGYIDRKGKLVIPFKYDKAWGFQDGYAVVESDFKYGVIDTKGKEVVAPVYNKESDAFDRARSMAENNGRVVNKGEIKDIQKENEKKEKEIARVEQTIQRFWVVSEAYEGKKKWSSNLPAELKNWYLHFREYSLISVEDGEAEAANWRYEYSDNTIFLLYKGDGETYADQYKLVSLSEKEMEWEIISKEGKKGGIRLKALTYPFFPTYPTTVKDLIYNVDAPRNVGVAMLEDLGYIVYDETTKDGIKIVEYRENGSEATQVIVYSYNNSITGYITACSSEAYKKMSADLKKKNFSEVYDPNEESQTFKNSSYRIKFLGIDENRYLLKNIWVIIYDLSEMKPTD